jgi:N-methylhydantoinase A/oxoprolinase/acetone carboxylase beta subunit
MRYGLGIDAGGTYTDAVVYDRQTQTVASKGKALSTPWDFTEGIRNVLDKLDPALLGQVGLVSLSTTLATNAIVEGRGQSVGLLLMPAIAGFEAGDMAYEPKALLSGRISINGEVLQPVDPEEVRQCAHRMIRGDGVRAFAVSGYAGCINPAHEILVKQILLEDFGLPVTCGHELSDILDFQTRARTAIFNARIIPLLARLLADLQRELDHRGLRVPTVVVKGDGTLMSSRMAAQRPVETILSGPAASVSGALHLTGLQDAMVVDMGGTTTDTAFISRGAAAVCNTGATVKSVKTHVKAIRMRTEGLGGDSFIRWEAGDFAIGPRRVLPVAWLARHAPGAVDAIGFFQRHLARYRNSSRHMQILWRSHSSGGIDAATPMEKRILSMLAERPHSLDEIAERTGVLTPELLRIERLEENSLIQRCGFTPTDVLHILHRFLQWERDAAVLMGSLYAEMSGIDLKTMGEKILSRVTDLLVIELLKKQLDEEIDPNDMLQNRVCRTLVDNLLQGGNSHYAVRIKLLRPVVGIGAPIHFFLEAAARKLDTRAVLPDHAAVANAVGAITSKVVIRRKLDIISDRPELYKVVGVSNVQEFDSLAAADEFAGRMLRHQVLELARVAGTSTEKIEFWREDRTARSAGGREIFLGRTLFAQISGEPDLVLASQTAHTPLPPPGGRKTEWRPGKKPQSR